MPRRPLLALMIGCLALPASAIAPPAATGTGQAALDAAIASPVRTAANVARDRYRHPVETLTFFGVRPTDTVVELWPGGGWYTEILGPYLASGGALQVVPPAGRYDERIRAKIAANPVYWKVRVADLFRRPAHSHWRRQRRHRPDLPQRP